MFRILMLLLFVICLVGYNCLAKTTSFIIFDEVFKTVKGKLTKVTEDFQKELDKDKKLQGSIINYGTNKEIARRERIIKNSIAFKKFDAPRITIIRGGKTNEARTVFYLVPINPEPPNITENEKIK